MALKIGDIFDYQGEQPNFARDTFKTLAEMRNYPITSIDEGHLSYCIEDSSRYKFSNNNTVDSTTGKWRREVDTTLSESSENSVQNKVITKKFSDASNQVASQVNTLNNRITAEDGEIKTIIETNEKIDSIALGDLKKDIENLDSVIGSISNDLKSTTVSTTTTINGHELGSDITITKSDIGLGNVDN